MDLEYNSTKTMYYGGDALVYHISKNFLSVDPNKTYDGLYDLSECFHGK